MPSPVGTLNYFAVLTISALHFTYTFQFILKDIYIIAFSKLHINYVYLPSTFKASKILCIGISSI